MGCLLGTHISGPYQNQIFWVESAAWWFLTIIQFEIHWPSVRIQFLSVPKKSIPDLALSISLTLSPPTQDYLQLHPLFNNFTLLSPHSLVASLTEPFFFLPSCCAHHIPGQSPPLLPTCILVSWDLTSCSNLSTCLSPLLAYELLEGRGKGFMIFAFSGIRMVWKGTW